MTEQVGMDSQGGASASPAVAAAAARPRIGAERFRALAERLKNPTAAADGSFAAFPSHTIPAIPVFAPGPAAVAEPDFVSQLEYAPETTVAEHGIVPEAFAVPSVDIPAATVIETEFVQALEPEPPLAHQIVEVDQRTLPVEQITALDAAPVDISLATVPTVDMALGAAPFPVFEAATPDLSATVVQYRSPLERVLASPARKLAPAIALPEILPPPPPPPPPRVVEDDGERVEIAPPSMDLVQQRLREDATVRLQQLDIENVWRQVLASPTLEERADYLREAAEIMAAEQEAAGTSEVIAPEHDLSRIIEALPEEQVATEPGPYVPPPVRVEPQTDEAMEPAELARSLLDMMSSGSNSGLPHERALAADTLLRMLPKLATKSLQMLAQRLAMMDNPPQLLVAKLIRDERVEVSGPLLEDCMHITDHDLAIAIGEPSAGKRRMVARRRRLSRAISDKLIATRDPSVLLTLVRNAGAEISHDGFIALTEVAAEMPDLMAPLSTRADLSAPNAFELFWPAPAQLRRYLLHRFLTDSETLTKILKITLSTKDGDETKDIELPSAGEITELLNMACRGKVESSAQRLGKAIGVDGDTIQRILFDRAGEAMVVLLKTAGYPRGSLGDLLPGLKRGEVPLIDPERDISELQSMFDTLSINKARILITYWDWAVRKAGPYAPVH